MVAVVVGGLVGPVGTFVVYPWFLSLPVLLLLLAVAVTICLGTGRRHPDAHSVGLGLVLALPVSAALTAAQFAALAARV